MLSIVVYRKPCLIIPTDGYEHRAHVMRAVAVHKDVACLLQDFTGNVEDVRIVVRLWWRWCRELTLSPSLKRAVIEFLRSHSTKANLKFSCYSFANLVGNIPDHPSFERRKHWYTEKLSGRTRPGDVVFIMRLERDEFAHAAVYIGAGLYMSVWGGGGDLEIATLKQMQEGYSAYDIVRATPKRT